jgi:hypothetical protein
MRLSAQLQPAAKVLECARPQPRHIAAYRTISRYIADKKLKRPRAAAPLNTITRISLAQTPQNLQLDLQSLNIER